MLRENVRRTAKILCLFMAVLLMMGMFPISASATADTIAVVINPTEPVAEAVKESNGINIWSIIAIIVTAIVATVTSGYRYYKKEQKLRAYHDVSYSNLLRENQALRNLKKATSLELANAQSRITALEDWRSRAIKNAPEIGNIVRLSYAKDRAEAYQKKYYSLDSVTPTYSTYTQFENAIADYQQLNEDVQKLVVGIDIDRFKQKRQSALLDYIKTAQSRLKQTDDMPAGVPREDSLMLARVIDWYENLPEVVKCEMPSQIITSLKMKKATADYNLEVMMATADYDVTSYNGNKINKLLDSVVAGSSKLFGKVTTWVTEKIEESRKNLNDPFENSYYDDDDDEFDKEDDTEENGGHQSDEQIIPGYDKPAGESDTKNVSFQSVEPGETYTL